MDIGSIAAKSTMVCQLMVLYAASTLRTHPVMTISTAARSTDVTGATGIPSTTIITIIAIMIAAAIGALWSRVTLDAASRGSPRTTQLVDSLFILAISFHAPCTRSTSPSCIFTLPRSLRIYSCFLLIPSTLTLNLLRNPASMIVRLIIEDEGMIRISATPMSKKSMEAFEELPSISSVCLSRSRSE